RPAALTAERAPARPFDHLHRLVGADVVEVDDDDARAMPPEQLRGRPPLTGTRAGDERDAPGQQAFVVELGGGRRHVQWPMISSLVMRLASIASVFLNTACPYACGPPAAASVATTTVS